MIQFDKSFYMVLEKFLDRKYPYTDYIYKKDYIIIMLQLALIKYYSKKLRRFWGDDLFMIEESLRYFLSFHSWGHYLSYDIFDKFKDAHTGKEFLENPLLLADSLSDFIVKEWPEKAKEYSEYLTAFNGLVFSSSKDQVEKYKKMFLASYGTNHFKSSKS